MNKIKAAVVAAAVLAGVGLAAAPASAGVITPAHCGSTMFGGDFLCGGDYGTSGQTVVNLNDGTRQVFVVGRDHAMWTRWTIGNSNGLSAWTSMGGYLTSQVIVVKAGSDNSLTLRARGGDDRGWFIDRYSNGAWSSWYTYGVPKG
ncbi:hypothetical protein BX285_5084 [Streptomyces sp. 1114.5]|uniref:hypothetical protein n=1 Tax=unclassified Streptomyces TaxID=2593676 RepID=UPI000BD1F1F1|nr:MULTISPECIES: hypothetical protein [unclassified Streptomyces]RKT11149.1 hypothetical protein BX285_5084 [Streptomyces sp. 1114.5]SOB81519.1 hypothetical protein SAMN06272789_1655 [Streptomyces sp. 1331.2]